MCAPRRITHALQVSLRRYWRECGGRQGFAVTSDSPSDTHVSVWAAAFSFAARRAACTALVSHVPECAEGLQHTKMPRDFLLLMSLASAASAASIAAIF